MEDIKSILDKASYCLNCKKPMCKQGCPVSTNIPEFINYIKEENFADAYNTLQANNIMSEICSIICPWEEQCTGKCVRGIKEKPVEIYSLEKFANEWADTNNTKYIPKFEKKKNKKIAVIGSGPAGIACSTELAEKGYNVTIYEKEEKPGGLLEYGIPDFRLEKNTLTKLIKNLENLGIKIVCNKEFGKNLKLEDLKKYDAIFLGIGASTPSTYDLTDNSCKSIYNAGSFLKSYNKSEKIKDLGEVIVIGGGNVAIDSARVAARLKAEKVTIVYRRDKTAMPAREIEVKEAINDGVEIMYNTKVIKAITKEELLENVLCKKTKNEENKVIDIDNSEFTLKADTIIFAIGFNIQEKILKKIGIELQNGLVKIDECGKTNIKGIYAGGDLVERKSTVARAIASGKKAAKGIIEYFES